MTSIKDKKRFSIGLSISSYAWLKKQAEQEGRSLAGMVNKIIQQAISKGGKSDVKPAS